MLSAKQKYSIASTLSTCPLDKYVKRLEEYRDIGLLKDYAQASIDFATKIDKIYGKKDGFIPKNVLALCT